MNAMTEVKSDLRPFGNIIDPKDPERDNPHAPLCCGAIKADHLHRLVVWRMAAAAASDLPRIPSRNPEPSMTRTALPTRRPNLTTEAMWNDHPISVTVGFDLQGNPREVFANTLRGGDMQAAIADACVLVSIALQSGIGPAALAKSLGRVPAFVNGEQTDAPASPIGTMLECVLGWRAPDASARDVVPPGRPLVGGGEAFVEGARP